MATVGAHIISADLSPAYCRDPTPSSGKSKRNQILKRRLAVSNEQAQASTASRSTAATRSFAHNELEAETKRRVSVDEYCSEGNGKRLKDYFDEAERMIRSSSSSDGGPPRWFSPLECGPHSPHSPLLLFLPGIDGVGLGLIRHHQRLGKIFDVWSLHIPVKDRTSFTGLVKLIETTVRSENYRSPKRPIYLVGESLGACLALAVASRNPRIDLVLVLSNPATSFSRSALQSTIPLLELMPSQITLTLSSILSLMTGNPLKMVMDNVVKGLSPQPTIEQLSQDLVTVSSYLPVLADILQKETLLWKLELLKAASAYANARLHAVKAQTLVLSGGKDQLLPSQEEGQRLTSALPKSQLRSFEDHGHFLFLEDGVDLVTIIKGASYYRRGKSLDYISDFMPPTATEFNELNEENRWMSVLMSPVMLSTLEDGKIVRGLSGIPSEGPVLLVGYHNLMGFEVYTMVPQFLIERKILLRGLTHPILFVDSKDGGLPDLGPYDKFRIMGAVPVSAVNFYKLMSSKSHALLYPGGMREAMHRKIVLDVDDQMKIPFMKSQIEEWTKQYIKVRTGTQGEVGNQPIHFLFYLPKFPGRFYYYFGKPIETKGRKQELRDKKKAHELYLEIKSEVENCLAYLKEKRENDPYRNILARLIYQATHGFTSQVPTFDL
ncbi:phytyl ester synthase 2, chloroplastic-like isoform X2 [Citrus sinensis]|uniref:phytyl ester synthase 2, chloroplastic-like isoform X2 n=1 Tax=Citrus sinensis TaxID=2711 RepID=UPI000D624859|nr:phytyl ester synthase 2, chloroplastic-like isoform X2 [Citrus sinensis]